MSQPSDEILGRLRGDTFDAAEIRDVLDNLGHAARVEATRALPRDAQRKLYRGVEGRMPVRLGDLVPAGVEDFSPVRHHGRNTLPAFNFFEKRFCRPVGEDREKPTVLYGFNFQTMSAVTGPGYFLAVEDPNRGEVWVDYNRVPTITRRAGPRSARTPGACRVSCTAS